MNILLPIFPPAPTMDQANSKYQRIKGYCNFLPGNRQTEPTRELKRHKQYISLLPQLRTLIPKLANLVMERQRWESFGIAGGYLDESGGLSTPPAPYCRAATALSCCYLVWGHSSRRVSANLLAILITAYAIFWTNHFRQIEKYSMRI